MANVQIFGIKNSQPTRAAERFFKERRVKIQFVDLKQKAMAPAEKGKHTSRVGSKYLKMTDEELLEKIERNPGLLRLPLVRSGNQVSIGHDEATWRAMLQT